MLPPQEAANILLAAIGLLTIEILTTAERAPSRRLTSRQSLEPTRAPIRRLAPAAHSYGEASDAAAEMPRALADTSCLHRLIELVHGVAALGLLVYAADEAISGESRRPPTALRHEAMRDVRAATSISCRRARGRMISRDALAALDSRRSQPRFVRCNRPLN